MTLKDLIKTTQNFLYIEEEDLNAYDIRYGEYKKRIFSYLEWWLESINKLTDYENKFTIIDQEGKKHIKIYTKDDFQLYDLKNVFEVLKWFLKAIPLCPRKTI